METVPFIDHSGTREARAPRVVRDFNTIDDLIEHAVRDLGATHAKWSEHGPGDVKLYFPRKDGRYDEASIWKKAGYWHAQGPGSREVISHLPQGAQALSGSARRPHREPLTETQFKLGAPRPGTSVRDYEAIDNRDRHIAGPFKNYSDAKSAAGPGGHVKYVRPGAGEARRGAAKADPRAVAFFRKNAGGVVGREDEGARALAHAEQEATARGWYVEWFDDPEGWDSLGDIDPETVKEVLYAVLKDENGEVLTSLGSIADPDRTYGRVVEAELALEALSNAGAAEARRPAKKAKHRPKAKRSARKKRR